MRKTAAFTAEIVVKASYKCSCNKKCVYNFVTEKMGYCAILGATVAFPAFVFFRYLFLIVFQFLYHLKNVLIYNFNRFLDSKYAYLLKKIYRTCLFTEIERKNICENINMNK